MNNDYSFAERAAYAALLIFVVVYAAAMLGLFFGAGISAYTLPIGIVLTTGYAVLKDRPLLKAICVALGALFACVFVSGLIIDASFDGMYFHKHAVIALKEGWNPVYQELAEVDPFAGYLNLSLWLENYPKGAWIFSAGVYAITNQLETAKAVNILFLIPVFASGYEVFRGVYRFSKVHGFILALCAALNPVFIYQFLTFYNDLAVGALFITGVFLCIKIYTNCASKYTYSALFCVIIASCSVKFTAPALVGLALVVFGGLYAVKVEWEWRLLKRPVLVVLTAFVTGVTVFGFDPYIKHVLNGRHILHPVMGAEKYDIMNVNPPDSFKDGSGVRNLFMSVFAESNNVLGQEPRLKIPFTVAAGEFEALKFADVRMGGFGVFFSGILILAVIVLVLSVMRKQKVKAGAAIALVFITLLALFFPESWWARYSSFTFYIPIFILMLNGENTAFIWLKRALCGLILVNSAIIIFITISAGIGNTREIKEKLSEIKDVNKSVILRVNDFPSHVALFNEFGINFKVSHVPLDDPFIFYGTTKYLFID
ncbi:MAG: hypothetical protein FWE91_07840 [Defluviitaleaceae bacterium]|nr:hypothetical protein [Defluviitaleaceae bacterium]MCL2837321.1 hypothetical protein [Defluviitaleaceae bacterium]